MLLLLLLLLEAGAQLDDRAGVGLIKRRELDDELEWSWSCK
jgi:hypothetical protein